MNAWSRLGAGTANVGIPRSRANLRPCAVSLFDNTTEMVASNRSDAMASAIATKFDPRPERRMPSLFIDDTLILSAPLGDHADLIPGLFQFLENFGRVLEVALGDDKDHSDTEIKG